MRMHSLFFLLLAFFFCTTERVNGYSPSAGLHRVPVHMDSTFRDSRFMTMRKGEKMEYSMPEFKTLEQWQAFRDQLRLNILISTGLYPMPEKTKLSSRIFSMTRHEDYTVEKVLFESYPGFWVTGNLYRPVGKTGPFPAILTPHGHWTNGRLEDTEVNSAPGRCINFARQGYIVFSYDMVGYQDSKQISHKFADSPRHQLWGINLMGLQLWNSIRSLDFVTGLSDVDSSRIACTGESGGGTQTFMLTAVDPRIRVAAPVNMVSAHFQGGCLCENAPGLRLDYFNVEIAAMAAPRPLLLVSTKQDWTVNNPTVEFPMIRSIYELYGAADRVHCVQFDYPHNYNKDSREAVYSWFGQWLLGRPAASVIKETAFTADPADRLRVFANEEKPAGDLTEESLTAWLQDQAQATLERAWPSNAQQLQAFKTRYRPVMQVVLAAKSVEQVDVHTLAEKATPGYTVTQLVLSEKGANHWIPALWFKPPHAAKVAAILVHPAGKAGVVQQGSNEPLPLLASLLRDGVQVLAIDCFNTGEHVCAHPSRDPAAKHFTTFNRTDCQERIQDILTAAGFFKQAASLRLYGIEQAGVWALLAAGVSGDFDRVFIDAMGGVLEDEAFLLEQAFLPGLARYGGCRTAAALIAPGRLTLINTPQNGMTHFVRTLYSRCGGGKNFTVKKKW
ncbi:hypothetical protein GX408_17245 [bacterium]|nr:hypothetical protein [bacterium]